MSDGADASEAGLIDRAVAWYEELLRGPLGEVSARQLDAELRAHRMVFGDRPICRVLRPYFVGERTALRVQVEVEGLIAAFGSLLRILDEDRELRAVLDLSAEEEELLAADRQGFAPDVLARIDGFLAPGEPFRIIEYNAESPGGIAFGHALTKIFCGLPVMEAFAERFPVRTFPALESTLQALLAADRERRGERAAPSPKIAIVDWAEAKTRREFELCVDYFGSQGYEASISDPRDLRYEGGRLHDGKGPIDIVYKRVLLKELLERCGVDHPLVQAVREGAVTCASGFGVHVLYRKELLAMLWDERVSARLEPFARDAVQRLLPWSRLVEDVAIRYEGAERRLLDVLRERRQNLVLKPGADYGGAGVVLGWQASPEVWEQALRDALEVQTIAQERVTLPRKSFPVWENGQLAFELFYADLDPYVWNGRRVEGFGSRLSPGELLNVSAGGGSAVPVMALLEG